MTRSHELEVMTIPWEDSGGGTVVEAEMFYQALAELKRLEHDNETLTEVNRTLHRSAVGNRDGRKLAEVDAKQLRLDNAVLSSDCRDAQHEVEVLEEVLAEHRETFKSILFRCEEGDPRGDWLPIVARMARDALAKGKP